MILYQPQGNPGVDIQGKSLPGHYYVALSVVVNSMTTITELELINLRNHKRTILYQNKKDFYFSEDDYAPFM